MIWLGLHLVRGRDTAVALLPVLKVHKDGQSSQHSGVATYNETERNNWQPVSLSELSEVSAERGLSRRQKTAISGPWTHFCSFFLFKVNEGDAG